MPVELAGGELTLAVTTLYGFLLVLARVAGALVFVPLPGVRSGPEPARVLLALTITLALFPRWPVADGALATPGGMACQLLGDAAWGLAIGVAAAFVSEALLLAAQVMGLQAGYAYASLVDPSTQADSSVLLVLAQLAAGLLFLALGLDREMLRIFARSLEAYPAPAGAWSRPAAAAILRLGAGMFATGLRLAMPALALLVLVDVALALLGRLNAHLQLLMLAFPAKMLAVLALLAWIAALFPRVYGGYAREALVAVRGVAGY